jgi:phenylpropionate dioxygenase-like ring-hydroxylating dioxygenase large terminal subunit
VNASTSRVAAPSASVANTPFLRNTWYVAAWASQLEPGDLLERLILNEPLVFARDAAGLPYALTDRCPHAFAPLSMGKQLPDGRIRCPYHGLEFDATGACVRNPHGNGNIPPSAAVRRYAVVERHRILWCWLGERTPDPTLIPDFSALDGVPDIYRSAENVLELDVHAELIVNNLLDLSHSPYLHEGVLGNEGTIAAQITVEQTGNTVSVERRVENVEIPGFFAAMLPTKPGERVHKSSKIRWDAPGCLLNDAIVERPADPSSRTGTLGVHLITPMTEHRAMYHFAAVRSNPLPASAAHDLAIQDQITRMRRIAFEEQDAVMIRAQQQRIDQALPAQLQQTLLVVDQAAVRKQRILSALLAAERTTA